MSFVVDWDGTKFDIDPNEFSGLELNEIKTRIGCSYTELLRQLTGLEPDAYRVLFWTVDRRTNPDLAFADYPGPPPRVYLPDYKRFTATIGKLLKKATAGLETPTTETTGFPSSSSTTDGSQPTTTTG